MTVGVGERVHVGVLVDVAVGVAEGVFVGVLVVVAVGVGEGVFVEVLVDVAVGVVEGVFVGVLVDVGVGAGVGSSVNERSSKNAVAAVPVTGSSEARIRAHKAFGGAVLAEAVRS